MKTTIFIFNLIVFTIAQKNTYELHKLKSFWQGEGSAVPYPDRLLLTSDKLVKQSGGLFSMDRMSWGKDFSLELTVDYHITEPENSQQNLIIALTTNKTSMIQYIDDTTNYIPTPSAFEGFVLYVNNFDTTHAAWFNMSSPNRSELLSRGKVSKISSKQKNQIRFLIRSKDNILNVYFEESRDKSLTLCGQFVDLVFPESFYFFIGASDDYGKSQISISKMTIETNTKFEMVPEENKKLGDNFLAYWSDDILKKENDQNRNPTEEISNFRAAALYYYDNAKVYSEELMDLADKTASDLKKDISADFGFISKRLQDATKIISKEADQLESLGWILTDNKNQHKVNLIEVLDMTVSWLETIEDSVAKTDQETKTIYELVKKLNVGTFTEELLDRSEQLISNIKRLNFKANFLSNDQSLNFLNDKSALKDMMDTVQDFSTSVEDKLKNKKTRSMGTFGFVLLLVVGGLLLSGFILVYYRISSAISKNSVQGF